MVEPFSATGADQGEADVELLGWEDRHFRDAAVPWPCSENQSFSFFLDDSFIFFYIISFNIV